MFFHGLSRLLLLVHSEIAEKLEFVMVLYSMCSRSNILDTLGCYDG